MTATQASSRVLVVLDDDPTGTQTVHDVPVLTTWSVADLEREMRQSPIFFVLTNSRGLSQTDAVELATEVGTNLRLAATASNSELEIVSRGDSTLRGHYPSEVDALASALGWDTFNTSIIPYFGPGGRLTEDDVHYVRSTSAAGQTTMTPVGETEFARDATFGFTSSNLAEWVQEKTKGTTAAADVVSLSLELARTGGETGSPATTARVLDNAPNGSTFIVNALVDADLAAFCAALDQTTKQRWIHRTAASFVAVRSGMAAKPYLLGDDLRSGNVADGAARGGLVVVGSHTQKTTEQLGRALELNNVVGVELDVSQVDDSVLGNAALRITELLDAGSDVILYTSRELRLADGPEASLALSRSVSEAVCQVVDGLKTQPAFLIAKGGITSSDIATKALGIERAMVLGQLQAGVPVWRAEAGSRFGGISLVVYPGNVGEIDGLAAAIVACRLA